MEQIYTTIYQYIVCGNNSDYNGSGGLGSDIEYNINTYVPFLKKNITINNINGDM